MLNRADLARICDDPKIIRALEAQQRQVADTTDNVAQNVAATGAIADATVLTLSPNDSFNNERILAVGDGLRLQDNGPGDTLLIYLAYLIALNGGFRCTFNLLADTNLDLPVSGRLLTDDFSELGNYADDAAAAAGGVAVGKLYRNGSALQVRVT